MYGTIDFDGKTYTLTEDAYVDNYGTNGDVRYYAQAIDSNGSKFIVAWDTTDEWDAAQAEAQRIQKQYEPKAAPYCEYPAILDDESNACDWDHPVEVRPL